jgi:integrase
VGLAQSAARRLVFRSDILRLPRPLPRYLPPDADRRLAAALEDSPCRLAADALLLWRACGLGIGELTDLELDCVHEVPGQGAWLKVPLGKLDTERMVPLDEETVTIIDRMVSHRCWLQLRLGSTRLHPRSRLLARAGFPSPHIRSLHWSPKEDSSSERTRTRQSRLSQDRISGLIARGASISSACPQPGMTTARAPGMILST